MKKIILSVDGMTCSACSNGLEKYLNKQNWIYNASVNLVMANAYIEYDEKILDVKKIEGFVKKAGFKSLGEFTNNTIFRSSYAYNKLYNKSFDFNNTIHNIWFWYYKKWI